MQLLGWDLENTITAVTESPHCDDYICRKVF